MKRTVRLKFFSDEATGNYGVAPEKTTDHNEQFYAFWSGATGIWHDVFEHWFELEHKYFKNDYGMNLGGEIVAMGAMFYYINELGIGRLRSQDGSTYFSTDSIAEQTKSDMVDVIEYGGNTYGRRLECCVPYQKPIESDTFESMINDHYQKVKDLVPNSHNNDKDDYKGAVEFKESITLGKLQRLYRYGYRMAERTVEDNYDNLHTANEFIRFFNDFTKWHGAEELSSAFKYLDVTITTGRKLKWKAKLIPSSYLDYKECDVKHFKGLEALQTEFYNN